MARPQKQGLDYFALDVNMSDEVELIEAEHGIEGFAVLIKMFQKIYREGYFYEWNERNQLLFSVRSSIDKNKLIDIIDDCIKWDIFDSELYEKHKILTSRRIQKHYAAAVYRRANVEMVEEYLLIDVKNRSNITLIRVSDDGNPDATDVSDIQNTQSKVNKIKVDESIVDKNIVNEDKVYENTVDKNTTNKVYGDIADKNKTYNTVFQTYNNQNIVVYKKLTDKIKKAMDKALRYDGENIILKAIKRYGQAFRDKEYRFCTYKMTLDKFLIQDNGYTDWLDDGQKWINYMDFKNGTGKEFDEDQRLNMKTKFHLAESRGDKYTADELEELILNNQRRKMEGNTLETWGRELCPKNLRHGDGSCVPRAHYPE